MKDDKLSSTKTMMKWVRRSVCVHSVTKWLDMCDNEADDGAGPSSALSKQHSSSSQLSCLHRAVAEGFLY